MTVTEYKLKWVADRRTELHARGMKDGDIARQMGYKPPYVSQVFNGDSVGDTFVDKMCSAFGFRFIAQPVVAQSTNAPNAMDPALVEAIKEVVQQGKRNNNVMDLLVEEIRSLREQVRTLKGQKAP